MVVSAGPLVLGLLRVLPWGGRAALRPGGAFAFAGGFGSIAAPVL